MENSEDDDDIKDFYVDETIDKIEETKGNTNTQNADL